jgi:hypothetical protein
VPRFLQGPPDCPNPRGDIPERAPLGGLNGWGSAHLTATLLLPSVSPGLLAHHKSKNTKKHNKPTTTATSWNATTQNIDVSQHTPPDICRADGNCKLGHSSNTWLVGPGRQVLLARMWLEDLRDFMLQPPQPKCRADMQEGSHETRNQHGVLDVFPARMRLGVWGLSGWGPRLALLESSCLGVRFRMLPVALAEPFPNCRTLCGIPRFRYFAS